MKKSPFMLSLLAFSISGSLLAQTDVTQTSPIAEHQVQAYPTNTQTVTTQAVALPDQQQKSGNNLPDNPSLWRVLMHKTGQTITRTGDAIQRGAERNETVKDNNNTLKENIAQDAKTSTEFVQRKADEAATFTKEKFQQGKEAIVGSPNDGTVPIVQGTLSQPSNNVQTGYPN